MWTASTDQSMQNEADVISVIVPTIGRPDSLVRLLESLSQQTVMPDEVLVADGSDQDATRRIVADSHWASAGLSVDWLPVHPPNAVSQRLAAIGKAQEQFLLLLDDDVVLEPECAENMLSVLRALPDVVGVFGDFNNQDWSMPTRAWRLYLRFVLGMQERAWQGKVLGPLLRFGYSPRPQGLAPMEWIGTCNTMIRRSAYDACGGFSTFFLHRCTMNEDVDLGLKLARVGRILFCPAARMAYHHAPGGRVSVTVAAEDDLFNRFMVIHKTMERSKLRSLLLIRCFLSIESLSNFVGACKRAQVGPTFQLLIGRLRGLIQVGRVCFKFKIRNVNEALH